MRRRGNLSGYRPWRAASLAAVIGLLLLGAAHAQSDAPPPLPPLPPIGGAPEIRAQLTATEYTTLSGEIASRIDRIATRVGDHFKAGTVLITFDCAVQHGQVARARAVLTQADKTFAVNQRLHQLQSMGQLELEVSRAEVEKARADLVIANAVASQCTIAAPFSGVTVDVKSRQYQYATPGQPILDVLNDGKLEVELIAPSRWLGWLKIGYPFKLHVDETNKDYPAKVSRIGGRVDPVSQSIKIIGEIDVTAPELLAGMSGRVAITPP